MSTSTDIYEFRNREELLKSARDLKEDFQSRWQKNGIEGQLAEMQDMEDLMTQPDFWDDPDKAREMSQRKSALEKKLIPWKDLNRDLEDFPDLVELTIEELDDTDQALAQLSREYAAMEERFEDVQLAEALLGKDDQLNAIVTISSGAGGTESQDWAQMLLRMYTRWFDRKGFGYETLDLQDGEEAGIKSASLLVKGESAFGYLKSENGVHRLVRISPFDSNKRRHTSFASVHVAPEIDDEIEVNIEEKDLRVDTYRASGAGGQHINKTDSAIRITHIPTGVVVQCQQERSQHKNRDKAMKMLRSRLYELEREKREEDAENRAGEKRDVSWGNQIRSYVFHPYKMVKDLRTGFETSDPESIMNGELDDMVKSYLKGVASGGSLKVTVNPDIE
ncbi:MAG TPA: peptide chain release factor 2 [Leptospiraceae bacterium]|nr:peptide chain release factor 2 [Spirochaetaceae bacterium]HBS06554.1 peptide chain release factor 2 [Leptospiraceae bacterium]|tara:strand:+ start:206412 stop:207587 length:1176 start_codon:yes stop_codon:yes gene_type:complete